MQANDPDAVYQKIYKTIAQIPKAKVATYGQIARLAGIGNQPRRVGYALSISGDKNVPWHRVVNAKGEISQRWEPDAVNHQRVLLMQEGIVFNKHARIDLKQYQWQPK